MTYNAVATPATANQFIRFQVSLNAIRPKLPRDNRAAQAKVAQPNEQEAVHLVLTGYGAAVGHR